VAITASELRQNVYRILDEALASGKAVEIVRRGQRLRIVPDRDKLANLKRRDLFVGDAEDVIGLDWSKYWKPDDNLP